MASSAVITVDLTGPVVHWGQPQRLSDRVVVPFTLDEPGSALAATALVDGQVADATLGDGDVTVQVSALWQQLDVSLDAIDDVDNPSTSQHTVMRGVAQLALAVAGTLVRTAGRVARSVAGRIAHPRLGGAK